MNSNNWPGYWYYPQSTTPANISGQNYGGYPPYNYPYYGYGYPAWNPQTMGHWNMLDQAQTNAMPMSQIQTSAATPMMPPNADTYQNNLKKEEFKEVWESPQSPQSPWIRAFEKYEEEEK